MIKVVVTEDEYRKAERFFKETADFECIWAPSDEEFLAAKIRETSSIYAVVGVEKYKKALYDAIPSGGVIARFGVGHDGIDKALAAKKGILCVNTPDVLNQSVAEFTIGLMLTLARQLNYCMSEMKKYIWKPHIACEISGKTLAVIGCGKIGCRVAEIAKLGFGMKTVGYDTYPRKNQTQFDMMVSEFSIAVKNADFVSINIPATPDNSNFINSKRLTEMKSDAFLINTSRGKVIDEDALFEALSKGTIAGAALDVFCSEPYQPHADSRDLRRLDNLLMTPHIASSTLEACERMAKAALENIRYAHQKKYDQMTLLSENVSEYHKNKFSN